MVMDENKFASCMMDIAMAYNRRDLLEEQALIVWYHFLRDFSAEAFESVVLEYVTHEPKAPSISDLIQRCKIKENKLKREAEIKREEEAEEVGDDW